MRRPRINARTQVMRKGERRRKPAPRKAQLSKTDAQRTTIASTRPTGDRRTELERLIERHFADFGGKKSIKQALRAVKSFCKGTTLDLETVKWIAEDPDLAEW